MATLIGQLVDEGGEPVRGLNVCGFADGSDGVLLLGYGTTDEDGAFAIDPGVEDLPVGASQRVRFDVLDGSLQLVHQVDQEIVLDPSDVSTAVRIVVPRSPDALADASPQTGNDRVAEIRVIPEQVTVPLGGRVILAAEARTAAGEPVGGVQIRWQARDAAGAEVPVSQAGELVGHAPGRLTVTVTGEDRSGAAVVVVRDPRQPEVFTGSAVAALAANDADPAPRWNDANARSAWAPTNRIGLGHARVGGLMGGSWLGPQSAQATEAATVGSANFVFSAPVVDLAGRGMDVRLDLVYNSRLWTRTGDLVEFDVDKGWPAPGWSLGFGRIVRLGREGSILVSPDGTRHPYEVLRLDGSQDRRLEFEGRTTDGTFIDYQHIDDLTGGYQWAQARFPDGTTIEYTARGHDYRQPWNDVTVPSWGVLFPTRITDAHGNIITIAYRNNIGPEIDTIVDTLGRTVNFHYDSTFGQLTAVTGPGLDGSRRTLVRLDIGLFGLAPTFSGLTASTPTRSPRIVRAIYYPSNYSGYWLREPGTYSAYGMVTKVTRHRDMGFDGAALTQVGTITPGTLTHQRSYNYPLAADPGLTDVPAYTAMTEIWEGMDTPPAVTRFAVQADTSPRSVEVTYPNGTRTRTLLYNRSGSPGQFDDGLPYQQEVYDGSRLVQLTTNIWQQGDYRSPRLYRVETTHERTLMTATEYDYGSYDRILEKRELDFGGSWVLRRTRIEYTVDLGYLKRHILRLPTVVETFNGTEQVPAARTEYVYDSQPLKDAPGVVAHLQTHNPYAPRVWVPPYDELECDDDPLPRTPPCRTIHHDGYWQSDYDASTRFRGNLTEIRRFADPAQRRDAVIERRFYDITGNMVLTEAGRYDRSTFEYAIVTQYANPSLLIVGPATPASAQITSAASYDFGTGLAVSTTDVNGRTTATEYSPTRLRPITVTWPTGATTTYTYTNHEQPVTMTLHLADGSMAAQRKADYNGLGLPRQTRTFVGVSDSDPTQLLYDITDNRYDPLGRIWAQASPYRTGDGPQWTVVSRDALGRITRTQAPDGSETHAHYDERAQLPDALADLDPAVMGRTTRLVDAWGRERWTWHNALGQLQIAIEPNPDGNGSVFAPGTAVTYYGYNALDQVTSIFQLSPGSTGQNRWFRYDGLGRLTHQWLTERGFTLSDAGQYRVPGSQPRWSDVYSYVDRTRLAWHMDARGVKTRLDYGDDPLGRLQSITYEQPVIAPGTLNPQPPPQPASAVRYAYVTTGDLTRPFRVTTDDVTRQYGYDNEGRLATVSMTLPDRPKRPFALDYRYDTAHRIHQIIYPAGYGLPGAPRKHVELEYDPGSRIQRLAVDGVAHAAEISYSPHGWPTELTIGPDSPVPIAERNDPTPVPGLLARQQVLRDGETLLDLSYQYTRPGLSGTTGQLTRATDNLNPERTITYEYDAAARLRQASGGTPDSPPLWTQHYSYDRYGNRTAVTASGTTLDGAPMPADGISGLEFGRLIPNGLRRNDNRISTPGFAYDEAGNLVRGQRQDGEWQRYRYDAAGRLITVTDEVGTPLETYTYGACRRRVRTRDERAGTSLCHIWHGNSVVAEYHGDSPQTPWVRSFVYLEDRLLCTFAPANRQRRPAAGLTEVVRYHHPDRLGTRLITTPETQDVIELTTLPYGTQLIPGPQPHEGAIFTSYRRSDVTQLDYAVNRDYDPWLARFIQPDPLRLQAIRIGEPQSNNAYTYSAGDPINRVDPTGLKWIEGVWIDDDALIGDEIVVVGHLTPGRAGDSPDENAREDLRREGRERGRGRGVDRDNRGAELARALFTGPPRPTTFLDLLFGGYLLGTLTLLTGGLLAIEGATVLGIGTVASPVGRSLGTVLSAIEQEYALAQPTTLEGAYSVVQQATASVGLETGVATQFSSSGMVLQNVGGVVTRLTATGGITVLNARGAIVLQLGR